MTSILVFLFVLSVLVFVHELGHFVAAKMCNVYVDRFSIGMAPRLFGFKYGETDYCIGATPFGGYVKMAGQEDTPLSEEERVQDYGHVPSHRWFNKRPVYQRVFILVAGPFMNIVLAVLVYAGLFAWGTEVPEADLSARIGEIAKGSAAETAPLYTEKPGASVTDYSGPPDATGWKTGDTVVSIDGKPIDKFEDVIMEALLGGAAHPRLVLIDRPNPDGSTTRYASVSTPKLVDAKDRYPRFGIGPFSTAIVGGLLDGMPGKDAGLKEGDVIERLDGELVDNASFVARVEKSPEGQPLRLTVKRGAETLDITVTPRNIGRIMDVTWDADSNATGEAAQQARPVVFDISDEYKAKTKLQRKDILKTINGQPATLKLLSDLERSAPDTARDVVVERPSIAFGFIQESDTLNLQLPVTSARAVGIALRPKLIFHRTPVSEILPAAFAQAKKDVERTVGTLVALVRRDVSMKDIGGPVMIFSVTAQAAEHGFSWLLRTMAFISVNLCVFNLLPLPVLDGGQIVVNLIEGIRRRPVSTAFLERYQMAGLLLIVMLMLFVTWNDVGRLFKNLTP